MQQHARRRKRAIVITLVGTLAVLAALVPVLNRLLTSDVTFTGLADGAVLGAGGLSEVALVAVDGGGLPDVVISVDGEPVETRRDGDRVLLARPRLAEGPHVITASFPAAVPVFAGHTLTRRFTVDTAAPVVAVHAVEVKDLRTPVSFRGKADGAVSMSVNGRPVPVAGDGTFAFTLPTAPTSLRIAAQDAAGNSTRQDVPVKIKHPGMRAVHMTAMGWSSSALRTPVLQLAEEGRIDTVQLDVKDESGEVGYDSQVPLARQIGASRKHYDAKAVVDELHAADIRVVGRVVAFRDPILARASWDSGARNRVIQTSAGNPWSGTYGQYAFTNFADPDVVAYNIALATEAARLGFDDILYDYVRRPEGSLAQMRIPGLTGSPQQAITDFLARSREQVRPHGAFVGASVFGIAADRPEPVAQDIPAIARVVDYVAPMVYPSHWGPGEYGVAQPEAQPFDITAKSVGAFVARTRETDAQVFPWLQAFSLRKHYGPAEVRAQITASAQAGATSFLLWNANCRYDRASFDAHP
ncbi:MAG: putative glycoside hydrolase [Kibdelosporangium sp.]